MFFNSTTKTIMKKIILTSLLFSLATLVNSTPTGITLTGSHNINENRAIGTTIGVLSSGSGAATYTLKVSSFLFDVGEQDGSGLGSNHFKVRPAGGNNNGDDDIIIATINYNSLTHSPAESLVTAIGNHAYGVTAEVVTNSADSGTVRLTSWPANLNGATLIGFNLELNSANLYSAITIDSNLDPLPISTTLDEQYFAISISSSGSDLVSAAVFDWETKSTYSIVVIATDSTGSYSESFYIYINDIDESLSLSSTTVAEHNAIGTTVGILATAGGTGPYSYTVSNTNTPNKTFTFTVTGEEGGSGENTNFVIEAIDETKTTVSYYYLYRYFVGDITNNPANILSYEINQTEGFSSEYTITGSYTGTITLTDWPDKYDGATLIGSSRTDIDYITIDSGLTLPSYLPFSTDGDKLITNAVFDQATQGSYTITINSTDANDIVVSRDFTITVVLGGTVTGITLAPNTINNQATDGTTVGLLSTDANNNGRVYVLENNTATFSISGDKLIANNPNTLQTGTISVSISTYNEATNSFPSYTVIITVIEEKTFSLDVDGNGTINAPNDGLIIFKYLLNSNANNLHTTIASDTPDGRKTTPQLKAYLDDAGTILDVDGNGTINAPNDGLIIFKYLLNSNANNLHTTIASDAPDGKKTTPQLKAYLDLYSE